MAKFSWLAAVLKMLNHIKKWPQIGCLTPLPHMYTRSFNSNCRTSTYREHSDFLRKESELLVVEVILEIDVNGSQCLWHIALLIPANQLQSKTITYKKKVCLECSWFSCDTHQKRFPIFLSFKNRSMNITNEMSAVQCFWDSLSYSSISFNFCVAYRYLTWHTLYWLAVHFKHNQCMIWTLNLVFVAIG